MESLRTYLKSIRQPYLSASQPSKRAIINRRTLVGHGQSVDGGSRHLSDAQRDQIDAEAKQLLRDVNFAIQNLADVEQLRQKAEVTLAQRKHGRIGLGALGAWASGRSTSGKSAVEEVEDARMGAINMHRASVLWYLRRQLEGVSALQMEMMEARLLREMEKNKSVLSKSQGLVAAASNSSLPEDVQAGAAPVRFSSAAQADDAESSEIPQQLTLEQLQLLAEENRDILKHYQDTLDQVRYV